MRRLLYRPRHGVAAVGLRARLENAEVLLGVVLIAITAAAFTLAPVIW